MIKKRLEPTEIIIDSNMDADDFGQRITDCVRSMNTNSDVVNLVKIHIKESVKPAEIELICSNISKSVRSLGIDNCIVVPTGVTGIKDITIDYIKVVENAELHS